MNNSWSKLFVHKADLQLIPTLKGGQSFRWKSLRPDNWIGVFRNKVWILSQSDNHILYQCFSKSPKIQSENFDINDTNQNADSSEDTENMLKSYFRLDIDLNKYYQLWAEGDPYFKGAAPKHYGIRMLNQEVTENIFSFICSSNNNIKRISAMVEKLCNLYGSPIQEVNGEMFYSFPTIEKLAGPTVESDLKTAGFGYRAKFISQSARLIKKLGGSVWLENLQLLPYEEAKKELMKLPGIGAKVADCICLMSLGHMEAVPVDTHIFQVATTTYLPHLKKYKSLTDKVYKEIADHFRSVHGDYAGWANTVLAKKGSSEEDDRHGYNVLDVWPIHRPARGPKPFKGKHGKLNGQYPIYVVSAPEYSFNRPPQPPAPQGMSLIEAQQFLENIMRGMQEVSVRAYTDFQVIEAEINRNMKNLEDFMVGQFQNMKASMTLKQTKEVQQAVKQGKDEDQIKECIKEREEDLKAEMGGDVVRTTDCINDATERARKAVTDARNSFTETSVMSAMQTRNWAQQMKNCVDKQDIYCAQQSMALIEQKAQATIEEGTRQIQKLQELPQKQMIQMNYCRQYFLQDLRELKTEYSNVMKQCIASVEAQQQSKSSESKVELDVQAQID